MYDDHRREDRGGYRSYGVGDEKKVPKVYISNLSYITTEDELKQSFGEFGRIVDVSLKRKDAVTFAFIEFEEMKHAEEAIEAMNKKTVAGQELKVELARGGGNRSFQDRGNYRGGDRGTGTYRGRGDYGGQRREFNDRPKGCFNCQEEGHFARDCPKPRKPRQYNNDGGDRYRGGNDRNYRSDRSDRYDRDRRDRRRSSSSSSRSRSHDRNRHSRRRRSRSSSSSR